MMQSLRLFYETYKQEHFARIAIHGAILVMSMLIINPLNFVQPIGSYVAPNNNINFILFITTAISLYSGGFAMTF